MMLHTAGKDEDASQYGRSQKDRERESTMLMAGVYQWLQAD